MLGLGIEESETIFKALLAGSLPRSVRFSLSAEQLGFSVSLVPDPDSLLASPCSPDLHVELCLLPASQPAGCVVRSDSG